MLSRGYRIIPVNPKITDWIGEKAYSSLLEVPDKIDIVNVFSPSDAVPDVVNRHQISSSDLDAGGVIHEKPREGTQMRHLRRNGPMHFGKSIASESKKLFTTETRSTENFLVFLATSIHDGPGTLLNENVSATDIFLLGHSVKLENPDLNFLIFLCVSVSLR